MQSKPPSNIAGYNVFPIQLPPLPSFTEPATHYCYIQPHEPRIPDPDSPRSLFIVNTPETSTELHFRHLFGTQLSAGRVERVDFHNASAKKPVPAHMFNPSTANQNKGKKRKRDTIEELEIGLGTVELPQTWDRELQPSGSHAVVVFADRPSMEASLKAIKKAAKAHTKIVWGEGIEDKIPSLGPKRYENHRRLMYPPTSELLRTVNDYMTIFSRLEDARSQEAAMGIQAPDEDGFITVTRGTKSNPARDEELKEMAEKQKEKNKGLGDFYRFQMRQKRKEQQGELLRKFEEDKKKVEEMKRRRGKVMPE